MKIQIEIDDSELNHIRDSFDVPEQIRDEMLAGILISDLIDRYFSGEYVDPENLAACIKDNTQTD